MSTPPRMAIPGATVSLVRRTNFRKAFLAPWDPEVNQTWLYSLAVAQAAFHVDIHMSSLVLNHHHTDVTPVDNRLSKFLELLHGEFSCALNALLVRRGYDRPRQIWDHRPTHEMRLVDEGAQCTQLVYDYLQNVAAGIVDRPEDMPGRIVTFDDWKAGGLWVPKLDWYSSKRKAGHLFLKLTPSPLLLRLFKGDLSAAAYQMHKVAEQGIQALRAQRTRPVLGAKGATEIDPFDEPSTPSEPGGDLIPSFRIGARGMLGRELHQACAVETTAYRKEHRGTFEEWQRGNRDVEFPFGNCRMVLLHKAKMKSAPPSYAILTRPGPTVADIRAELQRGPSDPSTRERAHQIIGESKDAFWQEAGQINEHAELTLHQVWGKFRVDITRTPATESEAPSTAEPGVDEDSESSTVEHPEVAVGSLGTEKTHEEDAAPRRRQKGDPKGGSDPPS